MGSLHPSLFPPLPHSNSLCREVSSCFVFKDQCFSPTDILVEVWKSNSTQGGFNTEKVIAVLPLRSIIPPDRDLLAPTHLLLA